MGIYILDKSYMSFPACTMRPSAEDMGSDEGEEEKTPTELAKRQLMNLSGFWCVSSKAAQIPHTLVCNLYSVFHRDTHVVKQGHESSPQPRGDRVRQFGGSKHT